MSSLSFAYILLLACLTVFCSALVTPLSQSTTPHYIPAVKRSSNGAMATETQDCIALNDDAKRDVGDATKYKDLGFIRARGSQERDDYRFDDATNVYPYHMLITSKNAVPVTVFEVIFPKGSKRQQSDMYWLARGEECRVEKGAFDAASVEIFMHEKLFPSVK
jgi:hypothetical protein